MAQMMYIMYLPFRMITMLRVMKMVMMVKFPLRQRNSVVDQCQRRVF